MATRAWPLRIHPRICVPWRKLLLLLALLCVSTTLTHAAPTTTVSCSSAGECCTLCGADSYRCARGPCSSSFITKGFFSISLPIDRSLGLWDILFVLYGTVPYVVPIVLALELIVHRRSWTRIFAFLFIPIVAMINMLILVKSLGDCGECSRPCGSCIVSMGMPSGHATNAIGLALWVILETLFGVGKTTSFTRRIAIVTAAILLFVPVPYSRVYLGDHTPLQVFVGSLHGVLFGAIYFGVVRFVVGKRLHKTATCCGLVIENDFSYSSPRDGSSIESDLLQPTS